MAAPILLEWRGCNLSQNRLLDGIGKFVDIWQLTTHLLEKKSAFADTHIYFWL